MSPPKWIIIIDSSHPQVPRIFSWIYFQGVIHIFRFQGVWEMLTTDLPTFTLFCYSDFQPKQLIWSHVCRCIQINPSWHWHFLLDALQVREIAWQPAIWFTLHLSFWICGWGGAAASSCLQTLALEDMDPITSVCLSHIPSLKLTARTWKMDGWNTIVSFWGPAYFQGRTVNFREGRLFLAMTCLYLFFFPLIALTQRYLLLVSQPFKPCESSGFAGIGVSPLFFFFGRRHHDVFCCSFWRQAAILKPCIGIWKKCEGNIWISCMYISGQII